MMHEHSKAEYRLRELLEAFPFNSYMEKKKELAVKLGIGRPQLDRLIRGDCDPSGTQLRIMSEFFGCSVDALYKPP